MQILESSVLGLRTARMVFRSRNSPISITLYPMVHVGEKRFYNEIHDEAFNHDIALVEGVSSSAVRQLTRAYRWLNLQKLDLIVQPATPHGDSVTARIVRADLTTAEFEHEWKKIPLVLRTAVQVTALLYGVHSRIVSSRERLARDMSLEDRRSADEILNWSPDMEPVLESVVRARDKRLIECMVTELDVVRVSELRMAIVYGAEHMRAVLRELAKRGFQCSDTNWRTIFSI